MQSRDLGGGRRSLTSKLLGLDTVLSETEVELLASCPESATLNEHASRICRQRNMSMDLVPQVRQILETFVDKGLMISPDELLKQLEGVQSREKPRITTVVLQTCDRPEALRRALESLTGNLGRFGRAPGILIVDDSRDIHQAARNREIAAEMAHGREGFRISLSDRRARLAYARSLHEISGVPLETIQFCLLGYQTRDMPSYGAARNTALLATQGEAFVSFDDDVVCRLMPLNDRHANLLLRSSGYRDRLIPFAGQRGAAHEVENLPEKDILESHERVIGCHPLDLVRSGEDMDLADLNADIVRRCLNPSTRVILASGGYSGYMPWTPLLLFKASQMSEVTGAEMYHEVIYGGLCTQGPEQLTIALEGAHLGGMLGIDNRAMTVPFSPVFRGEDFLFPLLARLSDPHACFAYLPQACGHLPVDPRALEQSNLWEGFFKQEMAGVIQFILSQFWKKLPAAQSSMTENLKALGHEIGRTGDLDEIGLTDIFRRQWSEAVGGRVTTARNLLERGGDLKPYHRRDLEAFLEAAEKNKDGSSALLAEIPGIALKEKLFHARGLLKAFGSLLAQWPALADAAATLKSKGCLPGEEL